MPKYITWYGKYITYGTEFVVDGAPTPPPPPYPTENMIFEWLFEDNLNDTADFGGGPFNLGFVGNSPNYATGIVGKSLDLNGTNPTIINTVISIYGKTISGWFQRRAEDPDNRPVGLYYLRADNLWENSPGSDYRGIILNWDDAEITLKGVNNTVTIDISSSLDTSNLAWNFFCLRQGIIGIDPSSFLTINNTDYDASGSDISDNGEDDYWYVSIRNNVYPPSVNGWTDFQPYNFDQYRMWNDYLTDQQVANLYNNGSGI
jgi:hypothetical protein